ncbi:MAG TPA: uroporphyrinogen-III synthase [Herpetosiphonaceae bacterium]
MTSLQGAVVALLEARMSSELASLVLRHGGEPLCVPAVRESGRSCTAEVSRLIDGVSAGTYTMLICATGVGVETLMQEAAQIGRYAELIHSLAQITLVCRGPKPVAALKRHGLRASITATAPYTTTELLAALEPLPLSGTGIALLHYGERNAPLAQAMEARGAHLTELCLYEWQLPEVQTPLRDLIDALIGSRIDAIAFTSQVQLRHLLQVAAEMGNANALIDALHDKTIVAAVGPTCAAALRQAGIAPRVVPEHPKMGQMIAALAAYITHEIEHGRRRAPDVLEQSA